MKTEILSPAVQSAHNSAARMVAEGYLATLRAAAVGDHFPTLCGYCCAGRHEIAAQVYNAAAARGVHNIKVRIRAVETAAKWEIKQALLADQRLAQKLVAVRADQKAREDADARAERASWPAFHFHG